MNRLGIVGFGQFGRYAAAHLRTRFEVVVADPNSPAEAAAAIGVGAAPLQEVAACPVVVLCVPVQRLPEALDQVATHLRAGALVLDVCSVKVWPLARMLERLPAHVDIVGTHPMFGPQSAPDSLHGHQIVVCPGRGDSTERVAEALRDAGLQVVVTDADRHDREAAYTQALAQYLGRSLRGIDGHGFEIRTPAAEMLREVERIVTHDSWELFDAIETLNPYAAEMRRQVRARFDELDARLSAAAARDESGDGERDSGEPG